MKKIKTLRIGTRGSLLALAQALETRDRLQEVFLVLRRLRVVVICIVKTRGDIMLDKSFKELGGKGIFTSELDTVFLENKVDLCVHSMKDVPIWIPIATMIPCYLLREDNRDALISRVTLMKSIDDLPNSSVVGIFSLRRQSQLMVRNPSLNG